MQSIQMSENKKITKKDDAMNVDALSKGKSKGKGKKGSSGKERAAKASTTRTMSCAGSVAGMATTKKTVDKSGGQEAKVG